MRRRCTPLLLLLFVIYASTLCTTSWGGINVYDALKPEPVCNATDYSSCLESGIDTLTQGNNMSYEYNGSLISEGGRFKLGFFERGDNNTYLGIWYNGTHPEAIVWVANRDNPIPSQLQAKCYLIVALDGNARLMDSDNHTYWSTGTKYTSGRYGIAAVFLRLSDSGNLMLMTDRGTRGTTLWQSFDNPTDTLLQGQGLGIINGNVNLTAWKSPVNPAQGLYGFTSDPTSGENSLSIYKIQDSVPATYWDSSFSSLPAVLTSFIQNSTTGNSTQRLVMNPSGSLQLWELEGAGQHWSTLWMAPADQCDANLFETCGSFGVCDAENGFMCRCLPGFEPNNPAGWESKDFSEGCKRTTTSEVCGGKVFLRLPSIKLPPHPPIYNSRAAQSEADCTQKCLAFDSCKCKAYSYDPARSNCQLWINSDDLDNIQEEYYNPRNRSLSIRLAQSDIDFGKRTCKICGTNVIPYPLSTSFSCGDPAYSSFQCNPSNGQLYFKQAHGGSLFYKVSHINPSQRKFVVQLPHHNTGTSDKCDTTTNIESKWFNLSISSPFNVTNCSIVPLIGRQVVEVELSWKSPPPPACNSSADCDSWANTICDQDANREKVCTCARGFHSDSQFMNCTKVNHKEVAFWVKVGIASTTCAIVLLLSSILCILHLRKRRVTQRAGIIEINKDNDIEDIDIPFVDYESILVATDNFSDANKLGAGGFGPVYKGLLVDGSAIAVKRLSAASVQGIEEFRNEVILIAKLQHRNLVKVLSYCIKEEEKILIYEYMPNKSLDAFLFDHTSSLLDWKKRFKIIMGITRGLLYLHQDSRLRIIHRDLKPSNILLDEELNPKISDFGLARIVAGNEMATSTARVIGTHGYMSPEYAMDGYFSIKSDVYSFGIVVLEIISGKRCTSLLHFDNCLISLLGYAWTLWDKGNPLELVDKSMDSCDGSDVKRCLNVGLLCVQEDPSDRPTMSTVLLMLSGDNMNLPYPKQPVFVARRRPPSETTSSMFEPSSNAELTMTLEGR